MLLTRKIRLKPTPEQEILFRKSAGVARWVYNYFLAENERVYTRWLCGHWHINKRIDKIQFLMDDFIV